MIVRDAVHAFRSFRVAHWVTLFFVSITAFILIYTHISSAAGGCYSGAVLGRTCFRGYFTNIDDRGGTSVLPVISGGQALPSSSINSAASLVSVLRAAYNSGNAQKVTGAAFIYNTMMDNNAPGGGRTVTNAQWDDLLTNLSDLDAAGEITWGGNVSDSINSFWQGTYSGFSPDGYTNDDAYYDNFKNEAGITIHDYNGNTIYKLLRRCANPVGYPGGPIPKKPIPPVYTLTPHITGVWPNEVESGSLVSVSSTVDNTGNADSNPVQWEITQMIVSPGQSPPGEGQPVTLSPVAPCQANGGAPFGSFFQSGSSTCKNVAKGGGVFVVGTPAWNLQPSVSGIVVDDLPAGTRLCFALSVQPWSTYDGSWAHSAPLCTVVGKKPKIQVWGGDVRTQGLMETGVSTHVNSGTAYLFGSWVEYAAFSVGTNTGFASGSGLNNGSTQTQPNINKFTFANVDDTGTSRYGLYAIPSSASISDQFTGGGSSGPPPSSDLGSLASGTYTTNDFTINTSTVGFDASANKGKSIVIIASGTVTIDGNIDYAAPGGGAFSSITQLPQVVIIANKINIADSATRINAWLLTTGSDGTINTCSDRLPTAPLNSTVCQDQLTINGPIATSHLYLRRTFGAAPNDPAEIVNLRPDAYIWAYLRTAQTGKATTRFTVELPPRF